ncbi:MAG TPA: fructosamine kinase family protein [Mariprofundaceae bacterium]|nr:fructosamine kinase family protein [Mariprofundaceae bacterium]
MLPEELRTAIGQSVFEASSGTFHLADIYPAGGGCINSAYRLSDADGRLLFLKLNRASLSGMFAAEFDGLVELRQPAAIRVPEPLCFGQTASHAWLVTEHIRFASPRAGSEARLGEELAALHRHTADRFGWHRDNTIGSTPQPNGQATDWIDFLRERRLGFQLRLAAGNGFRGRLQSLGERLLDDLPRFFDTYRPLPSLLHGDLWGGNLAYDEAGAPVIFDPAVYYGDREADLAMTELFGGFGRDFHAAYRAAWPLDEGYPVRKTLYNLYHILNHANLFGGGYASQAESMLQRLLAELR